MNYSVVYLAFLYFKVSSLFTLINWTETLKFMKNKQKKTLLFLLLLNCVLFLKNTTTWIIVYKICQGEMSVLFILLAWTKLMVYIYCVKS